MGPREVNVRAALLAGVLLAVAAPARAGSMDSKVTTGVIAEMNGDHAEAIEALETALADPSLIKAKQVPKAWFHLGEARRKLAAERPELAEPAMDAYAACLAVEGEYGDRYREECEAGIESASVLVFNGAILRIEGGDPDGARALCERVDRARPGWWAGPLCLGLVAGGIGDVALSESSYQLAIDRYEGAGQPNYLPHLAYSMLAGSRFNTTGDLDAATAIVDRGIDLYQRQAVDHPRLADALAQLRTTRDQLDGIAVRVADVEARALARPDDLATQLEYADVLQQTARGDEAVVLLDRLAAAHPESYDASFLAGAAHLNRAAALQADGADHGLLIEQMSAARPPLENALAARPGDPASLEALVQVSLFLGDAAAADGYRAQLRGE